MCNCDEIKILIYPIHANPLVMIYDECNMKFNKNVMVLKQKI